MTKNKKILAGMVAGSILVSSMGVVSADYRGDEPHKKMGKFEKMHDKKGGEKELFSNLPEEIQTQLQELRKTHKSEVRELRETYKDQERTGENREAMHEKMDALRDAHFEKVRSLLQSVEGGAEIIEKMEARKAEMDEKKAERKAKWDAMSDEEKQEFMNNHDKGEKKKKRGGKYKGKFSQKHLEKLEKLSPEKVKTLQLRLIEIKQKVTSSTKMDAEKKTDILEKIDTLLEILSQQSEG